MKTTLLPPIPASKASAIAAAGNRQVMILPKQTSYLCAGTLVEGIMTFVEK